MNEDEFRNRMRWLNSIDELSMKGFMPYGQMWHFIKDSIVYDFSTADLTQIDRIEREGLFVDRMIKRSHLLD